MADRRGLRAGGIFLLASRQRGVPMPCELQRRRGRPTAGKHTWKNAFDERAFTARDCTCVEETMKRFCLGIIVAVGLTLPAFALDGTRSPNNVPPVAEPLGSIQLQRAAAELLKQAAQLRRDGAELLAQANPGPTASLRDQLVGAWALVSCDGINVSNPVTCVNVRGIQIMDASGRYTRLSIPKDRPKFTDPNLPRRVQPAEEYKAAVMGIVANFGTWSVNGTTLTTHFDAALFPNAEGADIKTTISLSGDELKLVGELEQSVWQRIKK
jgi:Lipocalin-like domain